MMDTITIITLSIAIYGAILSTISAILAVILGILKIKESRRNVVVQAIGSNNKISEGEFPQIECPLITLIITNAGSRPIGIADFGCVANNGVLMGLAPPKKPRNNRGEVVELPIMLKDGEYIRVEFQKYDIINSHLKFFPFAVGFDKVYIHDTEGKYHKKKLPKYARIQKTNVEQIIRIMESKGEMPGWGWDKQKSTSDSSQDSRGDNARKS
jgi:hypothetical protein